MQDSNRRDIGLSKQPYKIIVQILYFLAMAVSATILIVVSMMPVFRIYGRSMEPSLNSGDIVIALRKKEFSQGDLIAFQHENKILIRRYIAGPGQWVDINVDGNISVDGKILEESYLMEETSGICDTEFPYYVPEGRIFCLGDNRSISIDSRSSVIGCVAEEQIIGKIVFRIWPLGKIGMMNEKDGDCV